MAARKIAVAATFGMLLVISVVAEVQGQRQAPTEFVYVALEAFLGFVTAAVLTTIAWFAAWRSGVKVWIDSGLHASRRQNVWPPEGMLISNRASTLLTSALFVWLFLPMLVVFLVWLFALNLWNPPGPLGVGLAVTGMMSIQIAFPVLMLAVRDVLIRRVAASTARQCWPEATNITRC